MPFRSVLDADAQVGDDFFPRTIEYSMMIARKYFKLRLGRGRGSTERNVRRCDLSCRVADVSYICADPHLMSWDADISRSCGEARSYGQRRLNALVKIRTRPTEK